MSHSFLQRSLDFRHPVKGAALDETQDDVEQEAAMEDKMVDPALISGDIAGLVSGTVAGRQSDSERHAFVFRAVALGDLALSALAYDKAVASGIGSSLA